MAQEIVWAGELPLPFSFGMSSHYDLGASSTRAVRLSMTPATAARGKLRRFVEWRSLATRSE